jgi:hypothetical protein
MEESTLLSMDEKTKAQIEKRAYELFVARGGQDGYHMADWLKAESEILKGKDAAGPAPKKEEAKAVPHKRKG